MLVRASGSGGQAAEIAELDGKIEGLKKTLETQTAGLAAAQGEWEKQFAAAESVVEWKELTPETMSSKGGATMAKQGDGTVLVTGAIPGTDAYTLTFKGEFKKVTAIRLEVLSDPTFPANGPGLSENGNFVLTEVRLSGEGAVKLHKASADHSQDGFPVANAIDGKRETGWAVLPQVGKPHAAVFRTAPSGGADAPP
jgi:hypothetical protein